MVQVLQLLAREECHVGGQVPGSQHGLELREHGLVLRGQWLGHRSQLDSTLIAMGTGGEGRGVAPVAGHGLGALPTSCMLARAGELREGSQAEEGRLRTDPSVHGSRRRT